ncbi:MAG: hypothetical protein R2748_13940 [Bryobacterales bacterium]
MRSGAIDALFGSSTVRVEGDRIEAAHRILGFGRTRSIRFGEIASIRTAAGSTQSETATQASHVWWNVRAERKAGGDFRIAQNLSKKQEAEWLAEQLRRRL